MLDATEEGKGLQTTVKSTDGKNGLILVSIMGRFVRLTFFAYCIALMLILCRLRLTLRVYIRARAWLTQVEVANAMGTEVISLLEKMPYLRQKAVYSRRLQDCCSKKNAIVYRSRYKWCR